MSGLVENQLVRSLEAADDDWKSHANWHAHATGLVDLIKSRHITRAHAVDLLVNKLRFAEAVGFGRKAKSMDQLMQDIARRRPNDDAC